MAVIEREYDQQRAKPCNCSGPCLLASVDLMHPKSSTCPCVRSKQECQPNLCGCFCRVNPAIRSVSGALDMCRNSWCWYLVDCDTVIRPTKICLGLGLFANRVYHRNGYLGFYGGEYTFSDDERKRDIQLKITDTSYVFTSEYKGMQVDALFVGNKTRYMNHMKTQIANVNVKIVTSLHRKFIVFFAKKTISKGEELLFDYGQKYHMDWKFSFDKLVEKFEKYKREKIKAMSKISINKASDINFAKTIHL